MKNQNGQSMLLEGDYYTLLGSDADGLSGSFDLAIRPESRIFEGHFPGNPVCPGVCGVELIRECAARVVGCNLRIARISKCRFLSVARPQDGCRLSFDVALTPADDGAYQLRAKMHDGSKDYMSFAGTVQTEKP